MAALSQLPSGKWRAQVRRNGIYRAQTFTTKREANEWATQVEAQTMQASATGYLPLPKGATLGDLIDKYNETAPKAFGKTKAATLAMLKDRLGRVRLTALSPVVMRDFIERRMKEGAGGVTIAADLSFLSAVLHWARDARNLDVYDGHALDARKTLKHWGIATRSAERNREPTNDELARLYAHWAANLRQRNDMETLCRFALATGMRQDEICRLRVEDVNRGAKTVVIRDRKDPKHKIGNDQTVPLLPAAWAIVAPLIEGREVGQVFNGARAASVSAAFTRACQRVTPPIHDLHFHDMRHRATAEFFRMGLDIPRVALLTGHKTWAMLRRYTDIKPADVHAVIEARQ